MSVVHILLRMLTLARMQQENEERMPNPLKKLAIVIAGHMGAAEAALSHLHGVLRVLARDHRRCQLLLDYTLEESDAEQRRLLWAECRQELLSHEYAEVTEVLSLLKLEGPLQPMLARHMDDALRNETLVSEVDALELGGDEWVATLRRLKRALTNHVYEEEAELFPIIEQALGQSGTIAAEPRFNATKQRAIADLKRADVPSSPPLDTRSIRGLPLHDLRSDRLQEPVSTPNDNRGDGIGNAALMLTPDQGQQGTAGATRHR